MKKATAFSDMALNVWLPAVDESFIGNNPEARFLQSRGTGGEWSSRKFREAIARVSK